MEKRRVFVWMCALTALAGLVNALSIKLFVTTVSHVTGLVSNTAISLAESNFKNAGWLLSVMGAFLIGAILSAYITGERKFLLKPIYGYIVIVIGIMLFIGIHVLSHEGRMIIRLFAFLMGIQNGMIVSFKGVLVRMTHMTGYITDLGVFIGYRLRGIQKEDAWVGIVPFCGLIVFTVGGVLGLWLFNAIGFASYDVTSLFYVALGVWYLFNEKRSNDRNLDGIPDDEQGFSLKK